MEKARCLLSTTVERRVVRFANLGGENTASLINSKNRLSLYQLTDAGAYLWNAPAYIFKLWPNEDKYKFECRWLTFSALVREVLMWRQKMIELGAFCKRRRNSVEVFRLPCSRGNNACIGALVLMYAVNIHFRPHLNSMPSQNANKRLKCACAFAYWMCRGSTEASMAHYMRECRLCNFKTNCCGSNSVFSLCLLVCLMFLAFMSKISQPFCLCVHAFVIVLNAYMRQYVKYCLWRRANVGTANRTKWRKKRSQSLCVSLCWPLFPPQRRIDGFRLLRYTALPLHSLAICWNTTICWARVQTQTAFHCVGSVSAKINLHASGKATTRRHIPRARVTGSRVSTQVALKLYDRIHSGISPMHKHFWTALLAC